MTRIVLIAISILCASISYAQTEFSDHIDYIEGIWIENRFKNYFDSIPSMSQFSKSLRRADYDISIYPIGLRIQSAEQKEGVLTVGYGVLHSHVLHPEVSRKCVQNNDTIYEQGSFYIQVNQSDSAGYYKIPDLMNIYAISSSCYIKIDYGKDTLITIVRKATEQIDEIIIEYKRISTTFTKTYPYPNPRDFYVRGKTLVGSYVLKDSTDKVISSNFTINPNGTFNGIEHWRDQKIEFNTDVFCGEPANFDKVIIYNPNNINDTDVELFIYKLKNKDTIQFFGYKIVDYRMEISKPIYTLEKIN